MNDAMKYLYKLGEISTSIKELQAKIINTEANNNPQQLIDELKIQRLQKNKLERYINKNFSLKVKLGELVKELIILTGINPNNVNLSVTTNAAFLENRINTLTQLKTLLSTPNNFNININITGDKTKSTSKAPFYYFLSAPLNPNAYFADGSQLIDNLSLKLKNNENAGPYTSVGVNNFGNMNFDFSLKLLKQKDLRYFYPASLLRQAVLNCLERSPEGSLEK